MLTRMEPPSVSVLSSTSGLQVSFPQAEYEVARGDDVTLTCSFTPARPLLQDGTELVIITWSAAADDPAEPKVRSFPRSGLVLTIMIWIAMMIDLMIDSDSTAVQQGKNRQTLSQRIISMANCLMCLCSCTK